jgi:DNA-binding transcriptional LysR family regulator
MLRRVCNELGGFQPDIVHRSDDMLILLALVAAGSAVTLLPHLIRPGEQTGVRVLPLPQNHSSRVIFAAIREASGQRPAITTACSALAQAAREVAPESRP